VAVRGEILLAALAGHAPAAVIVASAYALLVVIAATVGALHPEEMRRADARKVLGRPPWEPKGHQALSGGGTADDVCP
jgi:hypothetical protein